MNYEFKPSPKTITVAKDPCWVNGVLLPPGTYEVKTKPEPAAEPGPFTVMQKMVDDNDPRVRMAPLGNIIGARKDGNRHIITMGVDLNTFNDIANGVSFMGGLILVPEKVFQEVKKTMMI